MNDVVDRIPQRLTGIRTQSVIGATLLLLMVFLLFMSSRTGQLEFNEGKRRLDDIEALNLRLDAAMFWSLFELQMDFDLLTELQQDLAAATATFMETLPEGVATLDEPIERKIAAMEDFKTKQAVLRNSRAIAEQMIDELWNRADIRAMFAEQDLFAVERAFLNFAGRRDPVSASVLRETIETFKARNPGLVELPEWRAVEAHLVTFMRYVDDMTQLMQEILVIPVPVALANQATGLAERLSAASAVAGRYRIALFAVAVLLLAFSSFMIARVRQYLRMIERANDELESRVAERTKELASVAEALRAEIVERENVESRLEIARKLESIGELAAGIAHEINTPTQYVNDNVTFLEGVWRELLPLVDDYERSVITGDIDAERSRRIWSEADVDFLREEVPAALEQAASGLRQIGKIVLAMKRFSHPGSERLEPADLNKAIESTVTIARHEWRYVAELTLDLDPTLPAVPCNVSAFNQVVLNLVVNAAQAIAEQQRDGGALGCIKVSSRRLSESVEVSVEDNGPGVPDDIRDRVFDPFFTTKEVGKGTGQGLAIAHRVIHQQHNGTLSLEPTTGGKGARFVLRLPLRTSGDAVEPLAEMPPRLTA